MGMYTKFSIDLNVNSILLSDEKEFQIDESLRRVKEKAKMLPNREQWVAFSLNAVSGLNNCVNIYGHGEIKNYNNEIMTVVKLLVEEFPEAEGIVYYQYEEHKSPSIMLVSHGNIQTMVIFDTEFEGYGNACD